jgi:serine/threonine protein kinase
MDSGELVADRYRLASVIGRGAMGVVWLARDERLDRDVAVKQLLLDDSPDKALAEATPEQATERAMREARIAARLRHPNAIAVHDVVTHDGKPCLIMEYLHSQPLDAVMAARGGALPPIEVAAIGAQVAAALAQAHAAGIVHRDVKPENVLITDDGVAKITDFGVSRAAGVGTVTTTGILAGTPAYLAPEVAAGANASPSSDVFSFGAMLFAAVEGMPPFGMDENPIALLHRVAQGHMAMPQRSGHLTELLSWLLRRDPAERPTMRVAHEALAAAAEGRPFEVPKSRAPTLMMPAPAPAGGTSRRAMVIGGAAVALVAVGVVLGAVLTSSDSPTASPRTTLTTTTTPPPRPVSDAPTCEATYEVKQSWPNGYQVKVTVRNDGDRTLSGWAVSWTMPAGHKIDGLWAGDLRSDGSAVTVRNLDWNVNIPAGGQIDFGFNASAQGDDRPEPKVSCQQQ